MSGSLLEQKIPKDIQSLHREIKRLRTKGLTYYEITKYLNDNGWTTSQGREFYSSYVYNIEKRIEKRQSLLDRYKRTIENLRVEFHYDENKEKKKDLDKEKVKSNTNKR